MKKNYFLSVLFVLITSLSFGQDLIITGVIDGPLPGGYPKGIELYAINKIDDLSVYGIETAANGAASAGQEYTFPNDVIQAGTFIYLAKDGSSAGFSQYLQVTPQYEDGVMGINGDDTVILYKNNVIVDLLGRIGEDGTGKDWEYLDGWVYRKSGSQPNATFTASEWSFSGPNALDGCDKSDDSGTNAECGSVFPVGTFRMTANTDPTLKINSPTDGSTVSYAASIPVKISVQNFNVAASGGDGYIKWSLNSIAQTNKTDTNDILINVTAGQMYSVSLELVDNSGSSLSTPVVANTSFTVGYPCDLKLSTIKTTCDAGSSNTYNGTIAFSGGNTGAVYTINTSAGTLAGDNPSTVADGMIKITGITLGDTVTVTVKGDATSSCDFTRTLYTPSCIELPVSYPFDYTDGANLADQSEWVKINSGDEIVVANGNLEYNGLLASSGNSITFDGSGSEAITKFGDVTSGTIYASFLFKVTGFQTNSTPDLTDGGYFAAFASGNTTYDARVWVRPNPDTNGTTYDIGFGFQAYQPPFSTDTYELNDTILFVMSYNLDNGDVKAWINPAKSTLGTSTAPTASFTDTDDTIASKINSFLLRQDSTKETPFLQVDELKLGKTWADVTPKDAGASTTKNEIEGFVIYPNPASKLFVLKTASPVVKKVSVYNVLGRKVLAKEISGYSDNVNVSNLNSGVYILKVNQEGKFSTQKLVIK